MCKGINGDAPDFFNPSANACTNCIDTNKHFSVRRLTHPKVGELYLNNSTYAAHNFGQTSSITSHKINNPAIYKYEFIISPLRNNSFTSSGQAKWNTVGMHDFFLPIMIPPIPGLDASLTPM